ncbi:MAG: acireductone dioxygenase, partial [Bdellovibrionota bacterium]
MALLKLESGKELSDLNEIRAYLKPLSIELSHWPIEKTETVGGLLKADALKDEEKETLLKALDSRFEEQKKLFGYQTRALVVLHSKGPNIEQMLSIFDKTHRHS